ncbi:uncharacterized protein B0H64DRAFT_429035 [Chaetomium fimeti]|uniref:DNA polymerase epsilon subunit D n=1 Tax=Chaetomium fimeti TaxID=1854472 RepID=A0AAE0HRF6_9PEZI|nr:hypothetical protein B0H64DRAFT_429035 [Chaetomium fimeti]
MPSRKSDARRSDVSVARFVLADEDSAMTTESPAPEPAAPAASAIAEPSVSGSTPGPQQPGDKKDKDKERERERERERDTLTIEDLTLPKSIITRLAKGVLPPNTQIQANAILALTKSATVFISHLANAANDFTVGSNKKTINPADVFKALDEIEYGFMRERLEAEFAKFNEVQTSKRSTYRKKVAAAKKAGGPSSGDPADQSMTTDAGGSGGAADVSMMSTGSTTLGGDGGNDGDETETEVDRSVLSQRDVAPGAGAGSGSGSGGEVRAAKKARLDSSVVGGGVGGARMEVDGEEEVSDAETVPEEEEQEEEEDEEEEEEEEDEEEDDEDDEDGEGAEGRGDELEERAKRVEEDEALDDDSD